MATQQQMQDMLDLMKRQMDSIATLQAENERLREENETTNMEATGNTGGANNANKYKAKEPECPMINANIDDQEWALFIDSWARYKKMCNLSDDDLDNIRLELRECCSPDVNKFLFEYIGPSKLNVCTENELLSYIKSVAVKVVHKEVHRMAFNSLV